MLLWEFVFLFVVVLAFWSIVVSSQNIISLLISSEFIILVIFSLLLNAAVFFNINVLFGLAYLFIIMGGLELALSILLLLL